MMSKILFTPKIKFGGGGRKMDETKVAQHQSVLKLSSFLLFSLFLCRLENSQNEKLGKESIIAEALPYF